MKILAIAFSNYTIVTRGKVSVYFSRRNKLKERANPSSDGVYYWKAFNLKVVNTIMSWKCFNVQIVGKQITLDI